MPNTGIVAQSRLTRPIPATIDSASGHVGAAARCVTATKFGPGLITPARQTAVVESTAAVSGMAEISLAWNTARENPLVAATINAL